MSEERKQLKPYQGIIVFLLYVVMMIVIATPIQRRFGMYGVLITEVLILLLGILPAVLLKADLKEVFPIKRPKLRQIFGVIIYWAGSFLLVILVTLVLGYLFPQSYSEVNQGLTEVFQSVPPIITFLIIAVSPAICEEVLVRGFILSSLYSLKRKWLLILVMGIIFGLFHLNGIRFLPTGILGMALAYIMIETKNLLLPALFHFINNGLSSIVSSLTPVPTEAVVTPTEIPLVTIGGFLIIGCVAPLLLLWGAKLLREKVQPEDEETANRIKKAGWIRVFVAIGLSGVMFIVGVAITMVSVIGLANKGYDINIEEQVNQDTEDIKLNLPVEKSGVYMLDVASDYQYGVVMMTIEDAEGSEVCQETLGREMTLSKQLSLNQGMHYVRLELLMNQAELESYGYKFDDELAANLNLKGDLSKMSTLRFQLTLKTQ